MSGDDSLILTCPQCGSVIPAGSLLCPVCNPAFASDQKGGKEAETFETTLPEYGGESSGSVDAVQTPDTVSTGLPAAFQFQDVDFGPSDEELDRAFSPRDGRYASFEVPENAGAMASGAGAAAAAVSAAGAAVPRESSISDFAADTGMPMDASVAYDYSTASGDFTQTFDPEVWGDDMAEAEKPEGEPAKVVIVPVDPIATAGQVAEAVVGGGQGAAAGAGMQAVGAATQAASSMSAAGSFANAAPIVQAVGQESAVAMHVVAQTAGAGAASGAAGTAVTGAAGTAAAGAAGTATAGAASAGTAGAASAGAASAGTAGAVGSAGAAGTATAGAASAGTAGAASAGAASAGAASVTTTAASGAAASGAGAAAAAGGAAAKAGIPLAAKVVAGVLAVGIVGGGGYAAWSGQRVDYTANFVDAATQQVLAEPVVGTGNSGDVVELTAQDIEGYQLEGAAEQSVTLESGHDAQVTFLYQKEVGYTVFYVDQDGADVQAAQSGTGLVGDDVTENAPQIDGYELTSNDAFKLTLQEDESANAITFTYAKKVSYTVRYVGADGTDLLGAVEGEGVVGAVVEPGEAPIVTGYTLASIPQAITLSADEGENTMTFTYELTPQPVYQSAPEPVASSEPSTPAEVEYEADPDF